MSSTAVKVSGLPGKPKTPARAPLSVIPGRPAVRQAWFPLAMLATLVLGLISTLMINTALAEGSYERGALVSEATFLADRQESLTHELDNLRAPATLAQKALALGMVPAQSPAFVRLSDGVVLGVAGPATAKKPFTVITQPSLSSKGSEQPAAGPTTSKSSKTTKTPAPRASASPGAEPTAKD